MSPGTYRFGPFEIRTRTRELFKYGTKLKVRPQPFQVLQVLVEHAGDVVTREELQQRLWAAETFVDFEHGLNTCIKELRQILNDSARKPRYIETIPKLGYRIVAAVEAEQEAPVSPNGEVRPPAAAEAHPQLAPRARRVWLYAVLTMIFAAVLAGSIVIKREPEPENSIPVPLTTFPGVEQAAAWSPDGRQVAFYWNGEKQDRFDIYVMQPGSSYTLRLTTEPSYNCCPAWSPDGRWIAYTHREPGSRGNSLRLVSPLGGPYRTVFTNPEGIGRASWTPDGRAVVVEIVPAFKHAAALWAVAVDSGQRRQLTSPPDGIPGDTAPAVSPDGRSVAFCRATMWRTAEMYLMDLKPDLSPAGVPRRLTDIGLAREPAWTPDGRRIVFFGSREGTGLFQMDRDGRSLRRIHNVPADVGSPALVRRPGGYTSLVFDNGTQEISIWRYGAEGGSAPVELAPSSRSQASPRYSNDGKRLAFASDRTGYEEIWAANADGSEPAQLTDLCHILTETPDWSPSNDLIAFVSQDHANRQIYTVSASGGAATALTHEEGVRSGDGWARDGTAYYYTSTRSGRAEVWRVPRGGGQSQQITRNGGICGFESARGTFYYWKGENGQPGALFERTAQGDQPVRLATQGVTCRTAPSPNGFYFKSAEGDAVYLYDEATRSCLRVPQHPDRPFSRFTVSPDGSWLAINYDGKQSKDLMIMEHFR